ncbi:MAG: hypothetical protein ACOYMN_17490, partial [Roseimicrobium sp.]
MILRHTVFAGLLTVATAVAYGAEEKAPFDKANAEIAPIGLPSPYDKFPGLDQVLNLTQDDWKEVYGKIAIDIDAATLSDESDIALALGVKIADGVMSIKARDVQALNECSRQIEDLAKKLGVKDEEMSRAKTVRGHANKEEWLQVFMELGFLQTDIMKSLRAQGNVQRRSLIITAGWMQGLHYTSHVVVKHYSEPVSNYLREPLLVKAMQDDLNSLPAAIKQSPKVAKLIAEMPAIYTTVSIAIEGSISKDNVE